jgi:hypothetical protein
MSDQHYVGERRRVQRTHTHQHAHVILRDPPIIQCIVSNLTNLGACLHVERSEVVPANFGLSFDNARTVRSCEIVWRCHKTVGVIFA